MSRYIRGVPRDIALELRDRYRLDTFIETGTLIGYSAKWAARHFKRVYTIEFFDEYYQMAVNNLCAFKNVTCIKNNSVYALDDLRDKLDRFQFPLFWLDAHWAEEACYGRPLIESDVLSEIDIINLWKGTHAIIVDDVKKFSTPRWPNIDDVVKALNNDGKREVIILYDFLVAAPKIRGS